MTAARQTIRSRIRAAARRALPVALGVATLLTCWTCAALLDGPARHVIPLPSDVLHTLVADRFYLPSVAVTGWEALRGFVVGNIVALAMATACLVLPGAQRPLTRIAAAAYCAPAVAVAPVLSVLLDQDQAKVIIAALSVLFTTLVGAVFGLNQTPAYARDLAYVAGANRWTTIRLVRVRAAMPATVTALALSAPSALLGAIVGEYLGGDRGLGVALVQAQQALQVSRVWALATLSTGLAGLAYLTIIALGHRLRFVAVTTATAAPPRTPASASRSRTAHVTRASVTVLAASSGAVLAWFAVVAGLRLDPYLAKTPIQVLSYLLNDRDAARTLCAALAVTLRDALGGYLIGTVLALPLAIIMSGAPIIEAMFMPVVLALRSIPLVAMTPLVALIFGRGILSVTVLATTITVVPTLVNIATALRDIPAPALELARAYALSPTRSLVSVRLPYILPTLAVSARIAIPGALLGATLSEYLVTTTGLGGLIALATSNSDFNALWAAVVIVTAMSVIFFAILTPLENRTLQRHAA